MAIDIVPYRAEFAQDFARLNRHWLDAHDLFEPEDSTHIYSPQETIIDAGGRIFLAIQDGKVIGTSALMRASPEVFELAKLTVSEEARGMGLGRRLTQVAIDGARDLGARRLTLLSSTKLVAAVNLYRAMGFQQKPVPDGQPYLTADVYMELDLSGHAEVPSP